MTLLTGVEQNFSGRLLHAVFGRLLAQTQEKSPESQ